MPGAAAALLPLLAAGGGGAGGGATDIMGIGRIADEASEVIHELDRPWLRYYSKKVSKSGRLTGFDLAISKLDLILLAILALFALVAYKTHQAGGSGSGYLLGEVRPFQKLFLENRIKIPSLFGGNNPFGGISSLALPGFSGGVGQGGILEGIGRGAEGALQTLSDLAKLFT